MNAVCKNSCTNSIDFTRIFRQEAFNSHFKKFAVWEIGKQQQPTFAQCIKIHFRNNLLFIVKAASLKLSSYPWTSKSFSEKAVVSLLSALKVCFFRLLYSPITPKWFWINTLLWKDSTMYVWKKTHSHNRQKEVDSVLHFLFLPSVAADFGRNELSEYLQSSLFIFHLHQ